MSRFRVKHVPRTEAELHAMIAAVRGDQSLPRPPWPRLPSLRGDMPIRARLRALQAYISSFEYNHTGRSYFNFRKDRGLAHVTLVGKEIAAKALPIQCVEAVFLACMLTNSLPELDRFPVSFKSRVGGHVFRHIVLAVRRRGTWGALGLSRKSSLMFKDLRYDSLSDLVKDFADSYARCGHQLVKVYVGLPLPQAAAHSSAPIQWRVCKVRVDAFPWEEAASVLQRFSRASMGCLETYQRSGALPKAEFTLSRRQGKPGGERPASGASPSRKRAASRASPIRQRAAVRNGK